MPEERQQSVDGFSDNTSEQKLPTKGEREGVPGAPDPGPDKNQEPFSAEEYARLKEEAANEEGERHGS